MGERFKARLNNAVAVNTVDKLQFLKCLSTDF